ncbi:MAG: PolC-type DNA polymerase III [Clostridiales bacterium]|nr:PolC-type DNA polymerase III [Clostridiales bacterium]
MMTGILDIFPLNYMKEDFNNAVSGIIVDKIGISQTKDIANIYCHSDKPVHPFYLYSLEIALNSQHFFNTDKECKVNIYYPFTENYDIEKCFEEFKSYISYAIGVNNKHESVIFSEAELSVNGENIILSFPKNFLTIGSSDLIKDKVQCIFKEWFHKDINILCEFFETEEKIASPVYEFYNPDNYRRADKKEKPKDLQAPRQTAVSAGNSKSGAKSGDTKYTFKKKLPDDPDIIYGKNFESDLFEIRDLIDGLNEVMIKGMVTDIAEKEIRDERLIITIYITDFTDTIGVKIFIKKSEYEGLKDNIKPGKFLLVSGKCTMDAFDKELVLSYINGIKKIKDYRTVRLDLCEEKRVELHAHTQMSDMDAVTNTTSFVTRAFEWGHPAVAITDHGVVQSFPEASHALNPKKYAGNPEMEARLKNFKIIYGCEGYLVNDDDLIDEFGNIKLPKEQYIEEIGKRNYYHVIILCKNDLGRSHLYKLVSDSHLIYYRRRPRIPKSLLKKYKEGLIIGSACEAGEIFRAIANGASEETIENICSLYDYYEIQPISNNSFMKESVKYPDIKTDKDLQLLNIKVAELAKKHDKLCVATCDVHFLDKEDEIYRRIIMAGKGFADADNQPELYFRTTDEMLREFSYLGEDKAYEICVTNTRRIADMIEKIAPVRPDKCPPVIENSDEELKEMCYKKAQSMYGENLPEIVKTRLDKELNSIISNGYSVMYIIAQKLVKKSNDDGYLVGSRGSVGSSFVATMSGITEVNPLPPHYYCPECHYTDFDSDIIKNAIDNQLSGFDLPDMKCPKCGRRLVRDGQNIPFETFLGFYGDKEPDIDLNFSGEYQSKAHAYTEVIFGEGHTFKAGTIGTLAEKTAYGFILKYYEERGITKKAAEINRIVKGCVGVRRTTGQHPGGIVVLPHGEEIYTFTPVQHPANDMNSTIITTHFDYHSIDHNLLKLDILGHDDPTMIRFLEDLTGEDAKTWPMDDKKVISLFSGTEALGVTKEDIGCELGSLGLPELGTNFVMNMLKETKPQSFSDMIRISGLSHGTDVWTNNAQELIKEGKCTLPTAICTRDDIMTYLILKGVEAGKAFKIMESVRKGKGLTEEMEATMVENNIPDWYIWSCKKIKYMFPKAHACAYIMMAFRIAYCKVYHPLAYYAAYFSIRADDFDYEMMAQGYEHLQSNMDEIKKKISLNTNTSKEASLYDDMMIVREMYKRGFEFTPIDVYKAKANRFQIVDGKLMPSLITINGMGGKAAELVEIEAAKTPFVSRNEFKQRCKVPQTVVDAMNRMGLLSNLPEDEQLSLFDMLGE